VADPDPVSGAFLLPRSGMNFFRIPDLFGNDQDKDLAPESIRSKKKVSLHSIFHVGSGIRDEKNVWIMIWDEKMVGY
jgi:hypothetical protein